MRSRERADSLMRVPQLLWNILLLGRYDFTYDLMPFSAREMSLKKRMNLFWAGGNLIHRRLTPWSFPLHLQVELTNYCNLRCPICPTGNHSLDRKPRAMDVDVFARLMDEVGSRLLTLTLWAWGEPLLHPRLAEILEIASRHPVATFLSTNGQNLNSEKVIRALAAFPPAHLIVAIDGLTDETNSVYRVGARLAPILAGVRRLAAMKKESGLTFPILHMRFIVMRHNQHEVARVNDFARENGFDFVSIRSFFAIDAPEQTRREFFPETADERARDRRDGFICQQPFWFPAVFADGTVVGCAEDYHAQQPLGVLSAHDSFAEIWRSERAARVRRMIRDAPQDVSFCQHCCYLECAGSGFGIQATALNREIPLPTVLPMRQSIQR
jgi:MoaA/NifB/PqqE/SkfB family radical SAM enzyme